MNKDSYSDLEILLEMQSLCIWKTSDHKDLLQHKLSGIEERLGVLVARERSRRSQQPIPETVKPVGEIEDFRGNAFLPMGTI